MLATVSRGRSCRHRRPLSPSSSLPLLTLPLSSGRGLRFRARLLGGVARARGQGRGRGGSPPLPHLLPLPIPPPPTGNQLAHATGWPESPSVSPMGPKACPWRNARRCWIEFNAAVARYAASMKPRALRLRVQRARWRPAVALATGRGTPRLATLSRARG